MRKSSRKIAVIMAAVILTLSGCGSSAGNVEEAATNNGKGRFVENELDFSEGEYFSSICPKEDGSIQIYDMEKSAIITSDTARDTYKSGSSNLKNLGFLSYISTIAYDKTGNCMIAYLSDKDTEEQSSEESEMTDVSDEETTEAPSEEGIDLDYQFAPLYAYVSADGTVTPLELNFEGGFAAGFFFTDDGKIITYDYAGNVFEVDKEKQTMKKLFSGTGFCGFNVTKNFIIAIDAQDIFIYNHVTGEMTKNPKELTDYIDEQGLSRRMEDIQSKVYHFAEGENKDIYILNKNGLYRYVMDGSSVEQLIDGKLNTINNPSYTINSFIRESDVSFLILYNQGKLIRYLYDETVPSVPDTMLSVYSLKENKTVKQIISEYQKNNPDMYVDYEVGMSEDDGITYEDALKKLNTEIIAGDGPDILIMDGLPIETYEEKGMLLDLAEYKNDIYQESDVLTNITESFAKKKNIYAMPAKFSLPMITASKDDIAKIKDFSSLANLTEEIRAAKESGTITSTCTEQEIIQLLLTCCTNDFYSSKGIDTKKLKSFLEDAKRIYDSEQKGMTAEAIEEHIGYMSDVNVTDENAVYGRALQIPMENGQIGVGLSKGFNFDFNIVSSLHTVDNDFSYTYGLNQKIFVPSCILGISSSCTKPEKAVQFLATAFSKGVQDVELSDGFAVNTNTLQEVYDKGASSDNSAGGFGITNEITLEPFGLEIFWPDQDTAKKFDEVVRSVDTPQVIDRISEDTLYEIIPQYLNGKISVDEAVKNIDDKVKLRLAE